MGIHVRKGRNQAPGEKEEAALWNRWQEIKVDNIDSIPALEAMMLLGTGTFAITNRGLEYRSGSGKKAE
jgi:Protein of unknown function (DUF2857).